MKARNVRNRALYYVGATLLAFLMIYPLLWMVCSSFKETTTIFRTSTQLIPEKVVLENYVNGWKGFGGISFSTFFANSFFVTIISTAGAVISSTLVAFGFARIEFKGKGFWFSCMLLSMMVPFQVVMVPQYILYNSMKWIGTYLPLIVPYCLGLPFGIFLTVQFVRGIPRDLDEAARIDGCSIFGIFRNIILPLIRPAMVTTGIFAFIWKWDDFMGALLYLNKPKTYTISIALKLFCDPSSTTDWGAMFAMSTLSLVPAFLIFVFFQKYLVEGIAASGIKG